MILSRKKYFKKLIITVNNIPINKKKNKAAKNSALINKKREEGKKIIFEKSNLLLSKYKEVGIIASLSSEKLASELSVSLEKAKEIIEVAKKINS